MFWVTVAIQVASFIITALTRPRVHQKREAPKGLGDFSVTTATEGRPVPVIFGRVRIDGPNVLWFNNLTWDTIRKNNTITGYRYHLGLQWGLCRGPIDALLNIWVGKKLLWTGPHVPGDPDIFINQPHFYDDESDGSAQRGGLYGLLGFYFGGAGQATDDYLEYWQDPLTNYNGTCYAVWRDTLDGTTIYNRGGYVGNSEQLEEWQWEVERYPNGLGVPNFHHKVAFGANPACVFYELLTNTEYGLGEPQTRINTASFLSAAEIFYSEQNGFRYLWDSESEIGTVKEYLEKQTDSVLVFNHATGAWELVLFRLDYNPATVPVLDGTHVVELDDTADSSFEETFNIFRVDYAEPSLDYGQTYALAQDGANQAITGRLTPTTISYPGCKTANLANALAWRDLRQGSFPVRRFTVVLNRKAYGIKFGDVRRFTYGNFNFLARVVGTDYSNLDDNRITVTLMREIYRNEPGSFAVPDPTYWSESTTRLSPFEVADQVSLDAPRLLIDKIGSTTAWPQIAVMAMRQLTGNDLAVKYKINARYGTASGAEGATYDVTQETNNGFTMSAKLRTALSALNSALPDDGTSTIDAEMLSLDRSLDFDISDAQVENDFIGVAVIEPNTANEEWVICRGFLKVDATRFLMENCYRGAFDTTIKAHAVNARIWFMWAIQDSGRVVLPFSGVNLMTHPTTLPAVSHYYKLKLQPSAPNVDVLLDACTELAETAVPIPPRYLRPIPPRELHINGNRLPATVNSHFDTGGGVEGLRIQYRRIQWRNPKPLSQLRGFDVDGATVFSDCSIDILRYRIRFYDLVAHPTPVTTDAFLTTTTGTDNQNNNFVLPRSTIVSLAGGVPAVMRIEVEAVHTPSSRPDYPTLFSRDVMRFDFAVT